MQAIPAEHVPDPSGAIGPAAGRRPPGDAAADPAARDDAFLTLLDGFRRSGGLARGHEMATLLERRSGLNIGALARWIVEGRVLHVEWHHDHWFPIFQFGGPGLAPIGTVGLVMARFIGRLDAWQAARWFACPSDALGGRRPAETIAQDPDLVLRAAHRVGTS